MGGIVGRSRRLQQRGTVPGGAAAWSGLVALMVLAGCANNDLAPTPDMGFRNAIDVPPWETKNTMSGTGSLFNIGGASKAKEATAADGAGAGLGVNAYLWRGALDTLSFMPLASADPFGGIIITDWYTPPATSGERFKANAYILGRQLRADGVKVAIFRQVEQGGNWVDAPVAPGTVTEIENKVLAKARELRAQSASK